MCSRGGAVIIPLPAAVSVFNPLWRLLDVGNISPLFCEIITAITYCFSVNWLILQQFKFHSESTCF